MKNTQQLLQARDRFPNRLLSCRHPLCANEVESESNFAIFEFANTPLLPNQHTLPQVSWKLHSNAALVSPSELNSNLSLSTKMHENLQLPKSDPYPKPDPSTNFISLLYHAPPYLFSDTYLAPAMGYKQDIPDIRYWSS